MESIINWVKLPQRAAWPIVFVTGLLLWGPELINTGLGLDLFIEEYRIWVGVAFLFFLATGLLPVFPWLFETAANRHKERRFLRQQLRFLGKLTQDEKGVLRLFIDNGTKAQDLNIQDGVVRRLMKIRFLHLAYTISYGGRKGSHTFPVAIDDWVWDEIKRSPEYLE